MHHLHPTLYNCVTGDKEIGYNPEWTCQDGPVVFIRHGRNMCECVQVHITKC